MRKRVRLPIRTAKKAFPHSVRMVPSCGFIMEKVPLTSRVVNRDGRSSGDAIVPLFLTIDMESILLFEIGYPQ